MLIHFKRLFHHQIRCSRCYCCVQRIHTLITREAALQVIKLLYIVIGTGHRNLRPHVINVS